MQISKFNNFGFQDSSFLIFSNLEILKPEILKYNLDNKGSYKPVRRPITSPIYSF